MYVASTAHTNSMWLRSVDRSSGPASTSGRGVQQQWQPTGVKRRPSAGRCASSRQKQQPTISKRNSLLYELFDDGWGVEVAGTADKQPASESNESAQSLTAAQQGRVAKKARQQRTPYVDMRSEEGIFGLTLLQKALLEQQEQQVQQEDTSTGPPQPKSSSLDSMKRSVAAAQQQSSSSKGKKAKLPGFPGAAAAALTQLQQRQPQRPAAEEDFEDEGESLLPEFEIVYDQGKTEFIDGARIGNNIDNDTGLIEEEGISGMDGWGQFDGLEQDDNDGDDYHDLYAEAGQWQGTSSSKGAGQLQMSSDESDEDLTTTLIRDLSNEDDWGLEGLPSGPAGYISSRQRPGGRSLLDELTAAEEEELGHAEGTLAATSSSSVQWGGSGGATGLDLEEQEAVLRRYFKPQQVKKLLQDQVEVDASYSEFRKRAVGLGAADHKTQEKLRIVAGTAAGRKLISFRSTQTRPMMEKVRQAIFNMLQSQAGTVNCLPSNARWLDLFAGTGSVGIEALSRGVREAHFVEMDPVVVHKILQRNISSCGFKGRAWCHTTKAEDFLRKAAQLPRFAGGPFDFISVCPPYLLVSYPELFDLLEASPLVHQGSIVFVEYPKQLSQQVRDSIGPLHRVKDRKYGRTNVAVYAASSRVAEEEADADPFLNM